MGLIHAEVAYLNSNRFGRVETLAGFINALTLVFASGNIIWEAIERLFSPEELKGDKLLVVSILGLLVNLGNLNIYWDHNLI